MEYLGIKRHQFTKIVRPKIKEIRIGRRIFFERLDLDNFVSQNRVADGGPQTRTKICQDSKREAKSGTSTKSLSVGLEKSLYAEARERVTAKLHRR